MELAGIYPDTEIGAFANIIARSLSSTSKIQLPPLPQNRLTKKQAGRIAGICRELKRGRPLQYILGETSFYNCTIRLNGNTLIPRPETEELVDLIVKENRGFSGTILDIGTGSGCIAIALAVNLPGSSVAGTDISEGALAMASENARLNNASVRFFMADILNFDAARFGKTGIIVSNPPYVRESEKKMMAPNVLDFEPHAALFVPDQNPLVYYRSIMDIAEVILENGGKIYFEINEASGKEMASLFQEHGYAGTGVIKDLNGRDRIIKGIRHD